MILVARCTHCGNVFLPKSSRPRCMRCKRYSVNIFDAAELEELFNVAMIAIERKLVVIAREPFDSSRPVDREPGPEPPADNEKEESLHNEVGGSTLQVSDGIGTHARKGERSSGNGATDAVSPQLRTRAPARAQGREDLKGKGTTADGSFPPPLAPSADFFSSMRSLFFRENWNLRPPNDQIFLLRDAVFERHERQLGIDEIDTLRAEILRRGKP